MLSLSEVEALFQEALPEDVTVRVVPLRQYIDDALTHPYIQYQVDLGIYSHENIYTDFLSPAASYVQGRSVTICYDLICLLAEGVAAELTAAYIKNVALHEAHHFHLDHSPIGWEEHAEAELSCIHAASVDNPALAAQADRFELESPVFQRVTTRIEALKEARLGNERDEHAPALS